MRNAVYAFALILGLAIQSHGQTFTVQQPNCQIFVHFTAVNQTSPTSPNSGLDNRTTGCTVWNMAINVTGFSSVTVALQSAPDNNGVAGTWVAYAGSTIISPTPHNANPIVTGTQDFVWLVGYNPWVRVIVTSVTGSGSINGGAFGWNNPNASSSSTASSNVTIVGPLGQAVMAASIPVVIASNQSAVTVGGAAAAGATPSGNPFAQAQIDGSGNLIIPENCTKKAIFNNPSSGTTQLVAVSGSTTIRVCSFSFSGDTITTVKLVTGTGASCTSSADETGTYSGAGSGLFGIFLEPPQPIITTAAKTLCAVFSAGFTGGGTVIYSQR